MVTAREMLRHRSEDWPHVEAAGAISEPCVSVVPSATVAAAIDTVLAADATRLSHYATGEPAGCVRGGRGAVIAAWAAATRAIGRRKGEQLT